MTYVQAAPMLPVKGKDLGPDIMGRPLYPWLISIPASQHVRMLGSIHIKAGGGYACFIAWFLMGHRFTISVYLILLIKKTI